MSKHVIFAKTKADYWLPYLKIMIIKYLTFSLSIAFISWIVGMIITALIPRTKFSIARISHLNFIKNERINDILGLNQFKWIILHTFFKFFNPKLSMKKKIMAGQLDEYRAEMTIAELNHLFAFAFMMIFVLINVFKGLYLLALVILVVNILMNLYPSLLQQQNKRRIDKFKALSLRRSSPELKTF